MKSIIKNMSPFRFASVDVIGFLSFCEIQVGKTPPQRLVEAKVNADTRNAPASSRKSSRSSERPIVPDCKCNHNSPPNCV